MTRMVLWIVAILHAGNAAVMIAAPESWYGLVPGVAATGPLNVHFVRDVGLAYLMSAGGLAVGAWRGVRAAALMGAAWPVLHALYHLQIALSGAHHGMGLDFVNLAGIQAPAWAGLAAAWVLKEQG